MSDRPIQVGCLVCIVGNKNPNQEIHVGKIGEVYARSEIYSDAWLVKGADISAAGIRCSWVSKHLKRLDPDALRDDVPTKEELHA